MIGLDSSDETVGVYEETKHIFKKANMNVREWDSNCEKILKSIPAGESVTGHVPAKMLGLIWNRSDDTITTMSGFDGMTRSGDVTKHDVLHSMARIFDPLGLCSPTTIKGKIFLQQLWVANVTWDKPLSRRME